MALVSPLFSIVIPTFDRANFVAKTIASALLLDFEDFEILVIDDGSSDNTEEIVRNFTDRRIHYYKKQNGERGAARNYGAARAQGQYINFFDSDDLMYPNHLSVAKKIISAVGRPEFFHLAYDFRLEDGTVTKCVNSFDSTLREKMLFDNKLSCDCVFLRKDIALEHPFQEDRVLASSEDWELWIRLVSRFKLHSSNEITSSVVHHEHRSLRTIAPEKVVSRDLLLIEKLRRDEWVMRKYAGTFNRFVAERYTFFMLCFAERGNVSSVFAWGIRAVAVYPLILGSRRFLASIRNCLRFGRRLPF